MGGLEPLPGCARRLRPTPPEGADATAAAMPSPAKDGPLRTADGRTLPADRLVEYRGIWSFGSGGPSVDANPVFYLQPIDGKSGHYCYNLDSTPSCEYITYVYSEPEKKRAWAVQVAGKPEELMMFVENRGFCEIDGQYFPDRSDQGHRPAAGTVAMKMTHRPEETWRPARLFSAAPGEKV